MNAKLNSRLEAIEERLSPKDTPQWLVDRMAMKRRAVESFDWGHYERLLSEAWEKWPPSAELVVAMKGYLGWKERHSCQD